MKNKRENSASVERKNAGALKMVILSISIIAVLVVSILIGILLGSAELSPTSVVDVIKFKMFNIGAESVSSSATYIVWDLRLPRAILALVVGGGLAICGAAMQSITQNILADPYILGVSSGASAMVSLTFFLGGIFAQSAYITQLFAFSGAIIAMAIVYAIGTMGNTVSNTRLVLAGMAISIIFNAVSQLFITISSLTTTRSITMWMMGSLADARWTNIALPAVGSLIGLLFFFANARSYNLISLGDETAVGLGVNVSRVKKWTILVVAFVTGIIVSSCGIIGLVGFFIPHVVRILIGSDHRKLFPISYLVGSVFLVWMDILARTIMAPQEVPIGIFTALCGGPFFIWLLYRQTRVMKE